MNFIHPLNQQSNAIWFQPHYFCAVEIWGDLPWSSFVPGLGFGNAIKINWIFWSRKCCCSFDINNLVFFYLASWKILSNWTEQSQSPEYRWWYHRSQISRNTTEACDGRFWLWISETGIKVVQTKRSTHQTWFRESKKRICQRINVQMW